MKLLFVEGATRCYFDTEGNAYSGTNFHAGIQERYRKYCDNLTILNKTDGKIYHHSELPPGLQRIDSDIAGITTVPDLYRPRSNLLSISVRKKIQEGMTEAIRESDAVIIRVCVNYYTSLAEKICRRLGKTYMIELVEFVGLMNWYYGLEGKIIAPFSEMRAREMVRNAPYVIYVTQREQQKRYPTNGKSLGCSDVELPELDGEILRSRMSRVHSSHGGKVVFGTVGYMGSSVKGQEYVIRAMSRLKVSGVTNVEYHLAGAGSQEYLRGLAEKLGVSGQVVFDGVMPHEEIWRWYDSLDVYILPSMTEGLNRSAIEAMSRALPVTCSDAGGNPELASEDMIFHAGDVDGITAVIREMMKPEVRAREAERSFKIAHDFEKGKLDAVRDNFYSSFTGVFRRS